MKIRVKESVAGNFGGRGFVFGSGECDAPPALGKYLVEKGLAENIEEDKPKPQKVRVARVKAETRPVEKKVAG